MPQVLSLLVLAFAVSLDGFGVGAMYGLRNIKIPVFSIVIIAAMSGFVIFGSMHIGLLAAGLFPQEWAKLAGAVILIGIGIWALVQMVSQQDREEPAAEAVQGPGHAKQAEAQERVRIQAQVQAQDWILEQPQGQSLELRPLAASPEAEFEADKQTLLSIELKRLGLVIQILKTPSAADVDHSGNISASEAALLGLALSLDAFGAGFGAALLGFEPAWTSAVIAMVSGSFLYLGLRVGLLYSNLKWIRRLSFLPGCILILIGFLKML